MGRSRNESECNSCGIRRGVSDDRVACASKLSAVRAYGPGFEQAGNNALDGPAALNQFMGLDSIADEPVLAKRQRLGLYNAVHGRGTASSAHREYSQPYWKHWFPNGDSGKHQSECDRLCGERERQIGEVAVYFCIARRNNQCVESKRRWSRHGSGDACVQ